MAKSNPAPKGFKEDKNHDKNQKKMDASKKEKEKAHKVGK